jgi:hypothetical protein
MESSRSFSSAKMTKTKAHPLLSIAPRFRRSIHLESDYGDKEALDGYVVSPLARDAALRIIRGLVEPSGTRAWSLVGPYGTGKSSFLTYVGALLSGTLTPQAHALTEQFWGDAASELSELTSELRLPLAPLLVTGQQCPIELALLRSAVKSAESFWSGPGTKPDILYELRELTSDVQEGHSISDSEIVDAIVQLAQQVSTSSMDGAGLCLIVDEMGKFLEWAASQGRDSGDIYLLQLLAEAAARAEDAPILLITTLHQSLDAYAKGLPRATQVEWSKISGRFETVPFLETPRHLIKLLSGAINATSALEQMPTYAQLESVTKELVEENERLTEFDSDDLYGCFPLHPITSLCLGPLFRTRLGQNERSLFAFLSSHEPFGFQDYLAESGAQLETPYSLDALYDYVLANTGVRVLSESGDRTWAAAEQALSRLPGGAPGLDHELIKHIAILSHVGVNVGLRADLRTLELSTGALASEVSASLERLIERSAVVFREFKQAYHIWDGSDLNIPELIQDRRRKVKAEGQFAKRLQKLLSPYPVVASRHYHQTGTLRHLIPRYVGVPASANKWPRGKEGDGDLLFVVPDRLEELEEARALIEQRLQWLGEEQSPLVIALPRSPNSLLERILDYFAIQDALKNTPELSNDPVARRELSERKLTARDRLADAVATSFTSPKRELDWYWRGYQLESERRPSSCASRIFDDVYHAAPCIENELINRSSVSSYTSGARRELMELMMTHEEEERLGLEGYPAELSLYRSVLERGGLHKKQAGGKWAFARPDENSTYYETWKYLDSLLDAEEGTRLDFKALIKKLAQAPYGIREGVVPILLLTYYLTRRHELFLYEDNSFVPAPGDDMVARLVKRPATFELQQVGTSSGVGRVLEALGDSLPIKDSPTLFRIVRYIVQQVAGLSPYASKTQNLNEQARQVRSVVKAARDPVKLLLVSLPQAVGLNAVNSRKIDPDVCHKFAARLSKALDELNSLDADLLDYIDNTIRQMLGGGTTNKNFYTKLAARADELDGADHVPMRIRNLLSVLAAAPGSSPADLEPHLQGIGTAILGKPPLNWTDEDKRQFEYRAVESSRKFLASEELLLEARETRHNGQLIRVSVLDSNGNERHGVSTTSLDKERLSSFQTEVLNLAKEHGVDGEDLAFAVITSMMNILDSDSEKEIS